MEVLILLFGVCRSNAEILSPLEAIIVKATYYAMFNNNIFSFHFPLKCLQEYAISKAITTWLNAVNLQNVELAPSDR